MVTHWWQLEGMREIGERAGSHAVVEELARRGHEKTVHTVEDRFNTLGWRYAPRQRREEATFPFRDDGETRRYDDGTVVDGAARATYTVGRAEQPVAATFAPDKKAPSFSWRHANPTLREMQSLAAGASGSQERASIDFSHLDRPICVLPISDLHFGSFATDYALIERITDEILATEGLYLCLVGDLLQMAIKMRSILEVSDNLLTPALQLSYLESWLREVSHKVLFATWANHEVMREEAAVGYSGAARILSEHVVYFGGIGHADVRVGRQRYNLAAAHFFRGRSMYNPVHSQMRYMRMEAPDREICIAGDSHLPGMLKYVEGGQERLALNCGAAQGGGYARRFFSLKTWATYPCFTLDPDEHRFTPYWGLADWLAR